jgi:hypothetical protein
MQVYIFDADVHSTDVGVAVLTGLVAPVVMQEFHGKSLHEAFSKIADTLIQERQKAICAMPPATVTSP